MKPRPASTLVVCVLSTLLWTAAAGADGSQTASTKPDKEKPAKKEGAAKPALAKGMTAEQVLKLIGKPDEVRPIKNPNAKAEAWIYRRVLDRTRRETATHVMERPAFLGPGPSGEGTAIDPVTRQERLTIYQVTWVLMIEGRVEIAKQTREVEREFD